MTNQLDEFNSNYDSLENTYYNSYQNFYHTYNINDERSINHIYNDYETNFIDENIENPYLNSYISTSDGQFFSENESDDLSKSSLGVYNTSNLISKSDSLKDLSPIDTQTSVSTSSSSTNPKVEDVVKPNGSIDGGKSEDVLCKLGSCIQPRKHSDRLSLGELSWDSTDPKRISTFIRETDDSFDVFKNEECTSVDHGSIFPLVRESPGIQDESKLTTCEPKKTEKSEQKPMVEEKVDEKVERKEDAKKEHLLENSGIYSCQNDTSSNLVEKSDGLLSCSDLDLKRKVSTSVDDEKSDLRISDDERSISQTIFDERFRRFKEKIFNAENIIDNDIHENEKIAHFRSLCRKKSKEAFYFLYMNGYFFAGANFPNLIPQRKKALKKRLTDLKRNRVNDLWKYSAVGFYFLPHWKNLVILLGRCKNPNESLLKISLLLNYYLRPADIYMYNPVNGAGYKYYSGENLILYVVKPNMTPAQKNRLKKAWNTKMINKRDISNVRKVVFCLDQKIDWIEKDSNSNWCFRELYDHNPFTREKINFFANFFSLWIGKEGFIKNFKNHCQTRNIPIWSDCGEIIITSQKSLL